MILRKLLHGRETNTLGCAQHPHTALRHACTAPCKRSCGGCCLLLLAEGEEEACMTMDRTFSSALGSPFSNA